MHDLTERLSALLREPVRRLEDAQRAARIAEALADVLRASEKAERILADEHETSPGQANGNLAGKTLQDAAEAVLEASGKPLHAKELGRRIKARGWIHPRGAPSRPDQIVYQLAARLPRHPARFRRVAPNTFALVKWDDTAAAAAPRPRTGLFKGPGGEIARQIGDSPDAPAGGDPWRSS